MGSRCPGEAQPGRTGTGKGERPGAQEDQGAPRPHTRIPRLTQTRSAHYAPLEFSETTYRPQLSLCSKENAPQGSVPEAPNNPTGSGRGRESRSQGRWRRQGPRRPEVAASTGRLAGSAGSHVTSCRTGQVRDQAPAKGLPGARSPHPPAPRPLTGCRTGRADSAQPGRWSWRSGP